MLSYQCIGKITLVRYHIGKITHDHWQDNISDITHMGLIPLSNVKMSMFMYRWMIRWEKEETVQKYFVTGSTDQLRFKFNHHHGQAATNSPWYDGLYCILSNEIYVHEISVHIIWYI